MPVPGARRPRSSRKGLSVTRTSRIADSGTRGPLRSPPIFSRSLSSTTSSSPSRLRVAIYTASPLEPEPLEHRLVAAPLGGSLDLELEVDRVPDELLDERPRLASDLAHDAAALADEDLLLALRLRVEPHVHELVVQLDDLGGDRVRELLAHELEGLLADELRDPRLERHVGVGVGGGGIRGLWEGGDEEGPPPPPAGGVGGAPRGAGR